MTDLGATSTSPPNSAASAPRRFGQMLRRYSVGQNTSQISTSPLGDAPVAHGTSPPTSPVRPPARRSSEGQSSSSSLPLGVRLAPLRAAAASVFGSNRNTINSDASQSASATSSSPTPSHPLQDSHSEQSASLPASAGPTLKLRLVPFLDMTRSLLFVPTEIALRENGHAVQFGRFTERRRTDTQADIDTTAPAVEVSMAEPLPPALAEDQAATAARTSAATVNRQQTRINFKSKVVSRLHAEMWCESGGKVYIRDTRSSSGTFLNHLRLSPPGTLSRPFALKDGDVLQFGIDYQGGVQELYRCIKLRIELDHDTQLQPTAYGANMLRQLQSMQPVAEAAGSDAPKIGIVPPPADDAAPTPAVQRTSRASLAECCICLFKIKVCQALFIAPCSHMFHYKCIRPILTLHHPGFSCPLCRVFVNLDDDVEIEEEEEEAVDHLAIAGARPSHTGGAGTPLSNAASEHTEDTSDSIGEVHSAPTSPLHTSVGDMPANTQPLDAIAEQDSPALRPS
ncbi:hypothetical protein CBS9595_002658 [Malassezia furfur]|nr:hypothetical protein CBS9595_002658 [Malassezia furfur]